jgi:hypothetical protein
MERIWSRMQYKWRESGDRRLIKDECPGESMELNLGTLAVLLQLRRG